MPHATKAAANAYRKAWRKAHPELARERAKLAMRKWRACNKELLASKRRAAVAANPAKYKKQARRSHDLLMADPERVEKKRKYARDYAKKYREVRRKTLRSARLQREYGITQQQYDVLLSRQGGVCAICKETKASKRNGRVLPLHVDHCHASGKLRGILCANCNTALGKFRDDIKLLLRAVAYLKRAR